MIDLHETDDVINQYAERYHYLLPVSKRQASRSPEWQEVMNQPDWDESFPQINKDIEALDRAKGAY